MNVFSRLASALNQSFRLIFVSIRRGIVGVFQAIKKTINLLSKLIKRLHDFIATIIQLLINISSIIFVLFIPLGFFFDPLDWSRFLSGIVNKDFVFWGRMVLGGFFTMVAYFLVSGLIKSWHDSKESADDAEGGFVRGVAGLVSWVTIFAIFFYFTVFRLQVLPVDLDLDLANAGLPEWLQALVPYKFRSTVTEVRLFKSGETLPKKHERRYKEKFISSTTSYINWELTLKYPKQAERTDFKIGAIWYRTDESVKARQTLDSYVDEGWEGSQHTSGWGSKKPGSWEAGTYRIEFSIDGSSIAKRSFTVF